MQNSRKNNKQNNDQDNAKSSASAAFPNGNGNSYRLTVDQTGEIQRKTITRTFRLYEDLNAQFEKQVGQMNTTQTNLMNDILKQYLYWTSLIINHESPLVSFDSSTLLAFMETADDAKLESIVKGVATVGATDFIKFRWKKVNFRNIVRYLELLSAYANIGAISISKLNGNGDDNGGHIEFVPNNNDTFPNDYEKYEIAIRHHLGQKWSTFMSMFISNLFTTSISGTVANFETSNKSCFVYVSMAMNK
jgi:hypothetical protein